MKLQRITFELDRKLTEEEQDIIARLLITTGAENINIDYEETNPCLCRKTRNPNMNINCGYYEDGECFLKE